MPLKVGPQTYPNEIQTADFRVEEFRLPLMKAAIRMPAQSRSLSPAFRSI